MECFDRLYFKHEKTHVKNVQAIYSKSEQFMLFEISPFGVLHCVDYIAFIRLSRVAPNRKIFRKKRFSPYLFTVAMEMLISINKALSKTFIQA